MGEVRVGPKPPRAASGSKVGADKKDLLAPGTRVDVRSRYMGDWSHGFEVAEQISGDGYRVKRLSDGSILPEPVSSEEIRPERRKQSLWWF